MKRILTAALALTLLTGGAALAQPYGEARGHDRHDVQRYDRQDAQRYDRDARRDDRQDRREMRRWVRGQRLPASYRTRSHYVDYRRHNLRAPPRGYQWVQVDNNYALIALTTGLISQIIATR